MKKTALFLIFFITTTNLFAQKVFEGHISYSFKLMGDGVAMFESMMPTSMNLYSSKKGVMINTKGGMMASMMGDILSTPKGSYMIKHDEKTAYIYKTEDAESNVTPNVVKEDEVITINGMSCQKYKVSRTSPQGEQTSYVWINSDYKLPTGGKCTESVGVPGVSGIALKTMTSTGGVTVVLTATEFKPGKQDKKLFSIPKGYEKKDYDPSSALGF